MRVRVVFHVDLSDACPPSDLVSKNHFDYLLGPIQHVVQAEVVVMRGN